MTQNRPLRGAERLKAARELKALYEQGLSMRQIADKTGRSIAGVRDLLALAKTKMRPSGWAAKHQAAGRQAVRRKAVEPRVVVKRIGFRDPATPPAPTGPLNKTRLAEVVGEDLGIDVRQSYRVLDAVFGAVARTVTAGHDVTVTNFGTFRAVVHPARVARNPQTGDPVPVPRRPAVHFRVSPRLAEVVRAGDPTAPIKKRPSH